MKPIDITHPYNYYHFYLSAAELRTLNTIGTKINHIIYLLNDDNSSF